MFDEQENIKLERSNNWYSVCYLKSKEVMVERFKYFIRRKHEKFNDLEKRYDDLLKGLRMHYVTISDAEQISKFANALPLEWDEFVCKVKKDSRFSKFSPGDFIRELRTQNCEIEKKKKELIVLLERNSENIM